MKEAYWGYWLMVLGVLIVVVLLLVQSFTTTSTQDFYLVQAISEQAMLDSVDYAYFRQYGELKINKEKFFEVFIRRFAEEASLSTNYEIAFTEIYEAPPKVGIEVISKAAPFNFVIEGSDIIHKIDMTGEIPAEEISKN